MKGCPLALALTFPMWMMGCGGDSTSPDETGELVVLGSAQSPPPAAATAPGAARAPLLAPIGAPSSVLIGLYEF